jgi:tRNA nucleotidyltransferase (CCA-adding enzyme)
MELLHINSEKIHPGAIFICQKLSKVGYQAFLVGGCVRDLLLEQIPKDWDICTDAPPTDVIKIFDHTPLYYQKEYEKRDQIFPKTDPSVQEVINSFPRTIPTGLKHGTVTVCVGEGIENHFEVTTFRVEGQYLDGRRPEEVKFVQNVEEDLARRDFTINAMAYDPIGNNLIDPFNGCQDLKSQIIKTVGDPNARFQEDGLRIMRAARFAARLGYRVYLDTLGAMQANLEILKLVSRERVKDELWKILATPKPSIGLNLLRQCGILQQIEKEWFLLPVNTIMDTDFIPIAEVETKFAVLCGNFAAHTLQRIGQELKLSNQEFKKIKFLLEALDQFAVYLRQQNAHQARLFLAFVKNSGPDINSLKEFLLFSDAIGLEAREDLEKYQDEIVWARSEMQLNGDDLIQLGVPPGPRMKEYLDDCYREILRMPQHNTKEFLLKFIMVSL